MSRVSSLGVVVLLSVTFAAGGCADEAPVRSIGIDELRDKIAGAWVGQFAGVSWATLTEFGYLGQIMPEEKVPEWTPEWINVGFVQDDLYVEIPFLQAMRDYGVNCSWSPLADAFMATTFPLWHANLAGRDNLRNGIPVPDSGHYLNNPHCDDIDWLIEADFAGIIAPGLPRAAVEIAWRGGHVMNYGDGVYGGAWIAAMHAEAFFATSVDRIVEAGRRVVPEGSLFREVIDDVIAWHAQNPGDWTATWQVLEDKWGGVDRCPSGRDDPYNIDAKINAAYVLIGLLYGEGDFEESVRLAMRCGQDSDCNASTVGSILGNHVGISGIPFTFRSALDPLETFMYTTVNLDDCLAWCEELARRVLILSGGSISGTGVGEVWTVPVRAVDPLILEQWPGEDNQPPALQAEILSIQGRTVSLSAQASDPDDIAGYQWFFGDLDYASGPEVKHRYRSPGSYTALAYVSDNLGNTSFQTISVEVP